MNIFESLVAINIKNHTVELTGLAYSQEFDNTNDFCPQLSRTKVP